MQPRRWLWRSWRFCAPVSLVKIERTKKKCRMLAPSKYPIFELFALERRILLSSLYRVHYGFDDNNTDGWSTLAVENYAYGSSGQKYLAGPSTLTLSGLPAHTGAVVSFDALALDQWDGSVP